jgi:HipA-like C-terminal domain
MDQYVDCTRCLPGRARPKASVIAEKGHLWIAKFPSVKDRIDIGAWEMVVNELAEKAGINIAKAMARVYNGEQHSFLSKRFDRTGSGERIHFTSAMTLLGQTDGAIGASYLQLAEFILRNSASPDANLEELWRRIVFYIAVKNTDDHLRNHGFLLTPDGWTLSPAYDVNPVYCGTGISKKSLGSFISVHSNCTTLGRYRDKGLAPAPSATTCARLDTLSISRLHNTAITDNQRPSQQRHQHGKIQQDTRYSANVPQVLSAVLHTQPAGPDQFGQNQHLAYRHKH